MTINMGIYWKSILTTKFLYVISTFLHPSIVDSKRRDNSKSPIFFQVSWPPDTIEQNNSFFPSASSFSRRVQVPMWWSASMGSTRRREKKTNPSFSHAYIDRERPYCLPFLVVLQMVGCNWWLVCTPTVRGHWFRPVNFAWFFCQLGKWCILLSCHFKHQLTPRSVRDFGATCHPTHLSLRAFFMFTIFLSFMDKFCKYNLYLYVQ